jgi:mannose-1-phosphate guanylyltransferase
LAAGFGTRLRPLTDSLPKCLVPIAGEPLLGIWLRRLSAAGIGPFLVNTHYLSDQVADYLAHSPYADAVSVRHEETLLGTAGTLLANLDFFAAEDGLLVHADNWCLTEFRQFVAAHERRAPACVMTMMVFRSADPSSCGIVETDSAGVVRGFHEKVANPPGNLANGAVYLLSAEFLQLMRTEFSGVSDFSTQVLPYFVGRIQVYETTAPFLDIGTPASYAQAGALAAACGQAD